MKKITGAFCFLLSAQIMMGQSKPPVLSIARDVYYDRNSQVHYVSLNDVRAGSEKEVAAFINERVFESGSTGVVLLRSETDDLGFRHMRFQLQHNGYPVSNKVIIAHCRNGNLVSLNGDLEKMSAPANGFAISESQALDAALGKVNAKKYKWENRAEEQHMREVLNQPEFTYQPKAEKVVIEKDGKSYYAYVFNIYAEEPLYRANVFVDAASGVVLDEQNLICTTNAPATALTKYSGTQPMITDYNGTNYRLRETGRGNGIETYNLNHSTSYGSASDFVNSTTSWTTVSADQGATDAHWGAEMTYDYYWTQHNRNSINNSGFKLISYVHYSSNYMNAFWDGSRMTYGDGNGSSWKIFTALDVCGPEISHGLTANTAGLAYSNESGALNESYSDIFGNSIENFARPTNWNWKIGEDMTNGTGMRSMSNPGSFGDPDTYNAGTYYLGTADNGGVHTNSGVSNFWYYLLTTGGSGVNDLGNSYSVSGLGFTKAAKIAFRALTVYYTPGTNFTTARNLSIQAAKDLYGDCSAEVIATTNAWYAVGVGSPYIVGLIGADFAAATNYCYVPANVYFTNTTVNGNNFTWDFGDGSPVAATNNTSVPHTYTATGSYNVKLVANGCNNGKDSVLKSAYITVTVPVTPLASNVNSCYNDSALLNASGTGNLQWFDSQFSYSVISTGSVLTTPPLTANTVYYVASSGFATPAFGGMASNTGGGFLNSTTPYLVFNVNQSSILNSVVVYAIGAGNRIFQLRNANNTVLSSITVSLAAGANTVNLNFNLTPGVGYRLGLNSTSTTGLYRSISGVSYPYSVGGLVDITTSSAGSGSYFWYYNWKVTKAVCTSPKVPVVVTVNPLPEVLVGATATLACADDAVQLDGYPSGGTFSGNGVTGNIFSASTLGAGNYVVLYTFTDVNNCSNTASVNFVIDACTGLAGNSNSGEWTIYPNPFNEQIVMDINGGNAVYSLSDASGRLVMSGTVNSGESVNVSSLPKGLYILKVLEESQHAVKTLKLVKE